MAARPEAGAAYADAAACEAVAATVVLDLETFVCCSQTETVAAMATEVASTVDDAFGEVSIEAAVEVPEA